MVCHQSQPFLQRWQSHARVDFGAVSTLDKSCSCKGSCERGEPFGDALISPTTLGRVLQPCHAINLGIQSGQLKEKRQACSSLHSARQPLRRTPAGNRPGHRFEESGFNSIADNACSTLLGRFKLPEPPETDTNPRTRGAPKRPSHPASYS